MNKSLQPPPPPAAAYEPVQKHIVTPVYWVTWIVDDINYTIIAAEISGHNWKRSWSFRILLKIKQFVSFSYIPFKNIYI